MMLYVLVFGVDDVWFGIIVVMELFGIVLMILLVGLLVVCYGVWCVYFVVSMGLMLFNFVVLFIGVWLLIVFV